MADGQPSDFKLLMDNMGVANEFQQYRQDQAQMPPIKIKAESNEKGGMDYTFKMDQGVAQGIMQKMTYLEQALQAMSQEANRMQAQEQRTRQHPLIAALSTVAGELAQDKRLPPAVSALGRASLALNPPPDVLGARRMGLEEQIGRTSALGAEVGLRSQALAIDRQQHAAAIEEKKEENRTRIFHELGMAAQKGELTDVSGTSQMLQDAGHPKDRADTQAKTLVGISEEKRKIDAEKAAAKSAEDDRKAAQHEREFNARLGVMMQGMATKLSDKAEMDKGIEEVAQALAPMNKESLSAATAVSGMFGAGRMKIFARAREINPKFNWGQIDRMRKMEESFTVGKDGMQLQSFGTFLEHAGDLSDVYKQLKATDIPLVTKTWNWLRQNAGKPQVARVLAALDPVKKEFESFLLNNRAMYVVDRQTVDKIVSDYQSPAQMYAAVQQMGSTVKARYNELGNRYKQTMGQDLTESHPFTDEAIAAAKKIGVKLPESHPDTDPLGVLK